MAKVNVAIFASGSGTNADNFCNYFKNHYFVNIAKIYCNNPNAGVLRKSWIQGVGAFLFHNDMLKNELVFNELQKDEIDFIILAGFMRLIPASFTSAYPNKIINIHPALLPKYGGKGMYGNHVHEAVIANQEKKSGITIHLVNEHYDEGKILHQEMCIIDENDTAETLANKIHQLEHKHYPRIVEEYIRSSLT